MIDSTTAARVVDAQWSWFLTALQDAGVGVWDQPTRLTGWTVEDLARHTHWGITLERSALVLLRTGAPGRAAGVDLTGPRASVVPALQAVHPALVEELGAADDDAATVAMPYGDVPLPLARAVFVMEAAMHRSDLAAALGHPDGLTGAGGPEGDRAVLQACTAVLQAFWPALAAGATRRPPAGTTIRLEGATVVLEAGFDGVAWGPPAAPPDVVVAGSDEDVLLFAYGRRALSASGLTVTGDASLAARFKELVPGP